MGAVAGLIRFDDGPADAGAVAAMIDCVPHRGSDWRRVWSDGSAALGYRWRRLGPRQPPEIQPLVEPAAGIALVFDGRLDNRGPLADALDLDDLDTRTDAALTLSAYCRWGSDCVTRFLGDFAIAVWDARIRRLLLASDPLGTRGLSYYVGVNQIAFATESRQLFRVNGIERRVNPGFFAEWTAGCLSHPSETIFRGIHRVPPAHFVTATSAGVRPSRYWDIDPLREIRYRHDHEYAEHLRALLTDAVRSRLRGVDSAAVSLSGGLDSSSIVATATRTSRGQRPLALRALTVAVSDRAHVDDGEAAARVAQFCEVPLSRIELHPVKPEFYVGLARALEDTIPSAVGDAHVTMIRRAAEMGCHLVLDGTGGDEWLGGAHQHTADLLKHGRVIDAIRQLRSDAQSNGVHGFATLGAASVWALLPNRLKRPVKRLLPVGKRTPQGFTRRFADRVGLVDRITTPLTDDRFSSIATGTAYVAATDPCSAYGWNEIARQDEMFGVELTAPLMDRRIAEFAMAVPEEQRWSGLESKRVLREAMRDWLPEPVRGRFKSDGASAQFDHLRHLHRAGAFRAMELIETGILDRAAIDTMYREMLVLFADGHGRYKMLADRLWTLFLGECVWRALFGRHASPMAVVTEGASAERHRQPVSKGRSCGQEA